MGVDGQVAATSRREWSRLARESAKDRIRSTVSKADLLTSVVEIREALNRHSSHRIKVQMFSFCS
jgi:hypothetical protein